jgi:hypothetical protein
VIFAVGVKGTIASVRPDAPAARAEVLARFEVTAIGVRLVISSNVFTLPLVFRDDPRQFSWRRPVPPLLVKSSG